MALDDVSSASDVCFNLFSKATVSIYFYAEIILAISNPSVLGLFIFFHFVPWIFFPFVLTLFLIFKINLPCPHSLFFALLRGSLLSRGYCWISSLPHHQVSLSMSHRHLLPPLYPCILIFSCSLCFYGYGMLSSSHRYFPSY